MTQNSWPHNVSQDNPGADRQFSSGQPSTSAAPAPAGVPTSAAPSTSSSGASSKSEAAKDEAGNVVHHAKDAAQNVTETAKEEAASVASEAKTNARDLMSQAKADLTDQAGTQQKKVAEGLRMVSDELHSMASSSNDPGLATDLVQQAAERSSVAASWLDDRDPGSLLEEVKTFARQKPGVFLLLAAGAGIAAGRISRNLSAGDSGDSGGGGTGHKPAAASDPYPGRPAGVQTPDELGRPNRASSNPLATPGTPEPVDPLGYDPLDGGRL